MSIQLGTASVPTKQPPAVQPPAVQPPAVRSTQAVIAGSFRPSVGTAPSRTASPGTDDFAPRPTPPSQLPNPVAATASICQAIVDVLAGTRPLSQLNLYTSDEVRERIRSATRTVQGTRGTMRPRVTSVRVTTPKTGIVEACAVINGPRARAVALRLEGLDGRWQCTALALG